MASCVVVDAIVLIEAIFSIRHSVVLYLWRLQLPCSCGLDRTSFSYVLSLLSGMQETEDRSTDPKALGRQDTVHIAMVCSSGDEERRAIMW